MGSFIPPLYYGFYFFKTTRLVYFFLVTALGVFLTFGCSGIVPAIHFIAAHGISVAHRQASVGWMALMGVLYILGTIAYASRVPERFFPGRFNIWFQSHQIFHVLVVAAALVHLYGICQMAYYRFSIGTECN
ncbi:Adiponectin receptor protein [Exaiptasia diaphana]|nr:Adiponectin receptor protein [Exaiptasia diaphana]